jgi:4-hydroxysphinganine ceramide fatty acyl 2-hydroxylase
MMRATPESPRMFESNLLDFFSRIPWPVVPIMYVPVSSGLLYLAFVQDLGLGMMAVMAAAGFVWWTLTEYWLHRSLFHWIPKTSWGPKMHFILHGVHHDLFNDRLRLVMPPAASLGLAAVFIVAYYGMGQALSFWLNPAWVWAFFAGKIIGYMNYDLAHYYIHHGRPKLGMYKKLRAHHNAHHHNPKYKDRKFGVSFTIWDHVFRTY